MKIEYFLRRGGAYPGYKSTAYLDEPALADGSYVGTNKYTDQFVHVKWTGTPELDGAWLEVCERVYVGPYNYMTDDFPEIVERRPPCTCWTPGGNLGVPESS